MITHVYVPFAGALGRLPDHVPRRASIIDMSVSIWSRAPRYTPPLATASTGIPTATSHANQKRGALLRLDPIELPLARRHMWHPTIESRRPALNRPTGGLLYIPLV